MPKILIVSLAMSDAGKTTAARAVIRFMRSQGLRVCPFKPAGEFWLYKDWSAVSHALNQGRLYGKDAYLLRRAAQVPLAEEAISPAFRLVVPARHDQHGQYCPTLAARCTVGSDSTEHVIALDRPRIAALGLEREFEKLSNGRGCIVRDFGSLDELNRLVKEHVPSAIAQAHHRIVSAFDCVVYESAGFSAMPWIGLSDFDHVVAVNHGYLQLYDGLVYRNRFTSTHEIAVDTNWARDHEPREQAVWRNFSLIRTAQVVAGQKPLAEVQIPPLLADSIDSGFEAAVARLLSPVLSRAAALAT
jgi:predicted P-loop ATPase/GTPase